MIKKVLLAFVAIIGGILAYGHYEQNRSDPMFSTKVGLSIRECTNAAMTFGARYADADSMCTKRVSR